MDNSVSKPPKSPSINVIKAGSPSNGAADLIILKTDSLAERARKMNIIKQMRSQNSRENSREKSISRQNSVEIEIEKNAVKTQEPTIKDIEKGRTADTNTFKTKPVKNEVKPEPIPTIKRSEFERFQTSKEINETALRKSAVEDAVSKHSSKNSSYEAIILQDKVKEMRNQIEELKNDKRILALKLEQNRPTKPVDDVKQRLKAAEQLCEELMSENSMIKKELRGMETEIDEMHDAFHEEQGNECMKLRKELDQTNKNCRVLSFKLRKSEKRLEQMEQDKILSNNNDMQNKLHKLEEELKLANDRAKKLEVRFSFHSIP